MILPHSQGDPSGTYIESAGLGVPIVGFANAALRGHERHAGFAWTVPVGDIDGLVELVRRLADDPAEVQRKALKGGELRCQTGLRAGVRGPNRPT